MAWLSGTPFSKTGTPLSWSDPLPADEVQALKLLKRQNEILAGQIFISSDVFSITIIKTSATAT